jgi:chemotaxis protein methyltransferase CheR
MDTLIFQNLIKERCGLFFEDSIKLRLEGGILARMSKRGMGSLPEYFNCILRDPNEFNDLVDLLTVNETYFMREPGHLELLVKRLIPELLALKKPGEKVKIVSAGCSTGEEPYSVIMTLLEKYGTEIKNLFSVIGVDIDSNALRSAREGSYSEHSFRMLDSDVKNKYFVDLGKGLYGIKECVKDKAAFHRLNFLASEYPEVLKGTDVIYYRNVSIYFKPETQDRIFRKLAELLNENGCLIVSSTETLAHDIGILSLVEVDGIYLFRKFRKSAGHGRPAHPKEVEAIPPLSRPAIPQYGNVATNSRRKKENHRRSSGNKEPADKTANDAKKAEDAESLFDEAMSCAVGKKYDEALNKIDKLLTNIPEHVKALALKSSVLINLRRFEEAEGICLKYIGLDQWSLEGYLLLGLSAYFRGDLDKALKRFRESLYVSSSCWLVHFYLAEIYRSSGDAGTACREYGIVVKLLKRGDFREHGLTYFPFSFSEEHILHMCSHNLSRLKSQRRAASAEN